MKQRFWYKKSTKATVNVLQGLLAGLLVLCFAGMYRLMEGDLSFRELGKDFERTGLCFQTVEDIIREKVEADQNRELFEDGGRYNEKQEIDIRQYASGMLDETSANRNLSYYISDLITFGGNGAQLLERRIADLIGDGYSMEDTGAALANEASALETILPRSGISLADYVKMNGQNFSVLVEYYRNLFESSMDIAERYDEYISTDPEEVSDDAPSNVVYYVENTADGRKYTNLQVGSLAAACAKIDSDPSLTFLFDGERRYNIMVANSENVLNEEAAAWFMQTRFISSGEKVLAALNTEYPYGDLLQEAWLGYRRRTPYIAALLAIGLLALLLVVSLAVVSIITTGRKFDEGPAMLTLFDQIPTELAVGICLIIGICWWMLGSYLRGRLDFYGMADMILLSGICAAEYWIILLALLSLLRRWKAGVLWKNSVVWSVFLGTRQVYSARKSSQRLLIIYLGFMVLNTGFWLIGNLPGTVMGLVLNAAALLYLMRDVVGRKNVEEGLQQISRGKLDYRIRTDVLTGQSRQMGEAVNEMGEGLSKAVESMLQSERMKGELITNVSHDLKTPLTSIINYVDLLKREPMGEQAREYLEVLDQKTQRLKQLTEDLIEVSRIHSGNIKLEITRLQLKQFVMQAVGEMEDNLAQRGLEVELVMPSGSPVIEADGSQLWRVFENLLGNMAKYASKNTKVSVILETTEDKAAVRFENQMDQELDMSAGELMERFTRGDKSRNTEGSGLGLSIAKSLTELMGGTFDVKAEEHLFKAKVIFPVA